MPEFVSSHTPLDLPDDFTRGYFEAMEWTDMNADHEMEGVTGFSEELKQSAIDDCRCFQVNNADLLSKVYATGYGESTAGVDFWLTRNRHGAGFWDRGLGADGKMLSEAAKADGNVDLYMGDDHLAYGG